MDIVFSTIQESLIEEDRVQLTGFGSFLVRERPERQARDPQTGEEIMVPSRKVPAFKPGKTLKTAVDEAKLKKAN